MTTLFTIIGGAVVFWWLVGVVLLACSSKAFVYPGTPFVVKLQVVVIAGFVLPYIFLRTGKIPTAIIQPVDATEEEMEEVKRWLEAQCQCPDCMRRRGEL